MPIVLLRIDDRLVHGQVVEGWLPHLKVELVAAVSDAVVGDEVQAALMRMALPPTVDLTILRVADAPAALTAPAVAARRALVLVPGPAEALALIEGGIAMERVNVGGLHHSVGKVRLGRALFLDEKDRRALRALVARGVRLEGRPLPSDPEENVLAALEGS